MSIIVEATVPADEFALSHTLSDVQNLEVHAVRLVARESGQVMPFVWANCPDLDRLYETLDADPSVVEVTLLGEFDSECLLQIQWESRVRVLTAILGAEDALVLDVCGIDGTWHLQIFFPDQDLAVATFEFCREYGIEITVEETKHLSEVSESGYFGLTQRQYETVVSAYKCGYYEIPRAVNQEELADQFDVSHQALSERLRRAHETVITNALYHSIHRRDHSVSPRSQVEVDT